ncbi:MAG: C1 family peptidase [Alphaproteobacteria bacterium]|nr:C1 family peptidase [Alphaproteobacteria bacterium]
MKKYTPVLAVFCLITPFTVIAKFAEGYTEDIIQAKWGYKSTPSHTKEIFRSLKVSKPKVKKPEISKPVSLPSSVDLRKYCNILDQGQLGSCTANAIAGGTYARQIMEVVQATLTKKIKPNITAIKKKNENISRLFTYYLERQKEGTLHTDSGASIGDGLWSLCTIGSPRESLWPYNITKFAVSPPPQAYAAAYKNKDLDNFKVSSVDNRLSASTVLSKIKGGLYNGVVYPIGFAVYESFESITVAKTGIAPLPKRAERFLGGHAVLIVGYDDSKHAFIVANSWGTGWGQKGFFYMPYQYVTNPNLTDEIWSLKAVSPPSIALTNALHNLPSENSPSATVSKQAKVAKKSFQKRTQRKAIKRKYNRSLTKRNKRVEFLRVKRKRAQTVKQQRISKLRTKYNIQQKISGKKRVVKKRRTPQLPR